MKNFYITTAIDYANGDPHLGHAYEKVLADVIARFKRLKGESVYFLTGLDEHGQKVQQTAEREGVEPLVFCDKIAEAFKAMCKKLEISNDDYIRTTENRHKTVVSDILQKLYNQGDIYKAEYHGFYSTKEEQFLQEKDKVEGKWPESYGEVVEISESNYFFKLSRHREWLIDTVEKDEAFIFPRFRAKQVLGFLKEEINDLCISRPKERLSWGIPLPFDSDYVTYVWFDALINYISAIGYGTEGFEKNWPVDMHVIGKDILVPAHGVYWPIMLKAAGIPLPKSFLVHGWWLMSGAKMSKSKGNIINPMDLVVAFGADAFRYFMMREMNVGQDSDFSPELFLTRYNNDLGNDLGNLVSRLLNMVGRYSDGKVSEQSLEGEFEKGLKKLWETQSKKVLGQYEAFQFHTALENTFTFIRGINRYAELCAPWKLAKSEKEEDRKQLETCLSNMAEGVRLASILLMPVIPGIAERIQKLLGIDMEYKWEEVHLSWGKTLEGNVLIEKKCILFPRIELEAMIS